MPSAPFKPWLSFAEQRALLQSHGMIIPDNTQAEFYLQQIGYYRLSGYFYPFRQRGSDKQRLDVFIAGSNFQHILDLYDFDNQIRLLALEAIQYIEISMRMQLAHTLGRHNPTAHLQAAFFNSCFNLDNWKSKYGSLLNRHIESEKKAHRTNGITGFVLHHQNKYGGLPIWAACELWDFGALSKLFEGLKPEYQNAIAQAFRLNAKQLRSYLGVFTFVRNVSAHHSRLWNNNIINRPTLHGLMQPQWKKLDNTKAFTVFCLMQLMLKHIRPGHDWGMRFQNALTRFPEHNAASDEVSLHRFGIPEGMDLSRWSLWRQA